MKKLIDMTSFVLEQEQNKIEFIPETDDYAKYWGVFSLMKLDRITNYANFLQRPLTLSMFVPTDEHVNPLSPNIDAEEDFFKARDKVLFEGFLIERGAFQYNNNIEYLSNDKMKQEVAYKIDYIDNVFQFEFDTIEDLIPYNLGLTENALKLIK